MRLDTLLNEYEVAGILNIRVATLRRWRCDRKGPDFVRIGGAVRYEPVALDSFIASGRQILESHRAPTGNQPSTARRVIGRADTLATDSVRSPEPIA